MPPIIGIVDQVDVHGMTEQELRALVREAIARHAASPQRSASPRVAARHVRHRARQPRAVHAATRRRRRRAAASSSPPWRAITAATASRSAIDELPHRLEFALQSQRSLPSSLTGKLPSSVLAGSNVGDVDHYRKTAIDVMPHDELIARVAGKQALSSA